ncbi:Ku protein [uncultured Alsobacter sp.]|uniref:non-homologous end joining protein Ku n=1 Tax=uncultured Alsobacter sp. TaxID=1748258 RepID=UPI0025E636D0|nr:Ku protein [uncultured Alsobacter sp.]
MAPRANWKGYLKLSLVSCAVALYPASTASARIAFHTLNRATGHRLRRQMIDEVTGEAIPNEEQVRGYEVSKDDYVVVEDEELDAVALESTHTIAIERFVDRDEIDTLYIDSPYYLAPDDRVAQEAFAVIREAMREKNVVGLARVVMYRRERIVMLEPRGKGLFACLLRYPYEVRQDEPYFEEIPQVDLAPDMIALAAHIIDTMKGEFEPQSFQDRYEDALTELVQAKQAGRAVPTAAAPRQTGNVISLMDALRRSIAEDKGGDGAPGKAPGAKSPPKSASKSSSNSTSTSSAKPAAATKPAAAPKAASSPRRAPAAQAAKTAKKTASGKAPAPAKAPPRRKAG